LAPEEGVQQLKYAGEFVDTGPGTYIVQSTASAQD
jgi:hypothetical protein